MSSTVTLTTLSNAMQSEFAMLQASSFKHMKANAEKFVPGAGMGIWHKDSNFFNKGAGRQWEGVITEENLAAYDARMAELLPPEDVAWLEGGN